MPGMIVLRPADANEVVEAWRIIMGIKDRPVCLVLTRQALPTFDRTVHAAASGVARGAYILAEAPSGKPDVLLLATGSEVSLCLEARERLKAEGIGARVVSMPSWEIFEEQPEEYRDSVLPPDDRGSGLDRSGLHLRVGAIHRPQGCDPGDALLRPLGPDEGRRRALRVRARPRRKGGEEQVAARAPAARVIATLR